MEHSMTIDQQEVGQFKETLMKSQRDIDPEIRKVANEKFMDMLEDEYDVYVAPSYTSSTELHVTQNPDSTELHVHSEHPEEHPKEKEKRKRRPWVYKHEYDALNMRYHDMKAIAAVGYVFALILAILLLVVVS